MNRLILLIEDDEVLRDLMREWLETVFLETDVIVAQSDNGLMSTVKAESPCVILVDIDPVGSERLDLIRRLKRAASEAEIIVLTMEDHAALRQHVRQAGATACICKFEMNDRLLPMLKDLVEPEPRPRRGQEPPKTILCIEDELEMIKLIELTLRRGPFRVIGAVSGQQGLDVARRIRPDVVLLDLLIPDMYGWGVARRLRSDETLKDTPIIVVTVVHPSGYPARELDVDDYVTKPFAPEDLVRRVSEVAQVVA